MPLNKSELLDRLETARGLQLSDIAELATLTEYNLNGGELTRANRRRRARLGWEIARREELIASLEACLLDEQEQPVQWNLDDSIEQPSDNSFIEQMIGEWDKASKNPRNRLIFELLRKQLEDRKKPPAKS
jgi:hypothetical protein